MHRAVVVNSGVVRYAKNISVVRLAHSKIYAEDCVACDTQRGTLDQIDVEIFLIGDLSEDQRQRLMEIADRCPIHRH